MAKIICISNQKGGVGKSTIAFNLAYALKNGLSVAVIDTDLQGSLTSLLLMMDGIKLLPLPEKLEDLKLFTEDILIIDTPPYLSANLINLFEISDFILIPTKASFFDVMAIRPTIAILREVQRHGGKTKCGILLNMIDPRTGLTDQIINLLKEHSIPLLNHQITHRISYVRSLINGGVVNSKDKKAKAEILNLADEILNIITN